MSEEIKETYIRMLSHTIHYDCCYDADADNDFEKISDYIANLQQKVEQLENVRKETIEYLKKREYDNYYCSVCSVMNDDLLNILNKGSDK